MFASTSYSLSFRAVCLFTAGVLASGGLLTVGAAPPAQAAQTLGNTAAAAPSPIKGAAPLTTPLAALPNGHPLTPTHPILNAHPLAVLGSLDDSLEATSEPTLVTTATLPALQWNTFLGGSDPTDGSYDTVLDAAGNMYVIGDSGYSWGVPIRPYNGYVDVFVAKLDAQGNLVWNTFLGNALNNDYATQITLDAAGNLYLLGMSGDTWGNPVRNFTPYPYSTDVFAAKLDAQGNLVWNTFLGNVENDWPGGLGLDANGNLYVSGVSYYIWGNPLQQPTITDDGFVAKLNAADGQLLWNTFLGGATSAWGMAIVTDAAGNSYLTGSGAAGLPGAPPIRPNVGGDEAFVAKFNPQGQRLWHTYLGGGSNTYRNYHQGQDIVLDTNGRLTLTGESWETWGNPVQPFHGTTSYPYYPDVLVARLDADGNLLWHTFLGSVADDRGYGLEVRPTGEMVVAGVSAATWGTPVRAYSGAEDGFMAQLDANGNLTWNTFVGSGAEDVVGRFALDAAGNAVLAGYGPVAWGSPLRPYSAGADGVVTKISPTGSLLWHTFLGGGLGPGDGTDAAGGVAVDAAGNVYVTGMSRTPWVAGQTIAGEGDAFVAKLNAQGQLLWHRFFGVIEENWYLTDAGLDIVVNAAGEVFVTGQSTGTWGNPIRPFAGSSDAFVLKLDANGNVVWHTFLGGTNGDDGQQLVVDAAGQVVVLGMSFAAWGNPIRPYSNYDAFVAKLDANGNLLWNTFLGGNMTEAANGMAVAADGRITLSGLSGADWGDPIEPFTDEWWCQSACYSGFVAQLTPAGALRWNTFVGGDTGYTPTFVALDAGGNAFVAGQHAFSDAFVAKLDRDGQRLWDLDLGHYAGYDSTQDILVDRDGHALVAGTSSRPWGAPNRPFAGGRDVFLAKVDAEGNLKWNTFVGGVYHDALPRLAADPNMQIYVTGASASAWGAPVRAFSDPADVFVAKLDDLAAPIGLSIVSTGAPAIYTPLTFKANLTQGTGLTYTWNFGDGSPLVIGAGRQIHQYPQAGVYTVNVTATNSLGSQQATTQVTITAQSVVYLPVVVRP